MIIRIGFIFLTFRRIVKNIKNIIEGIGFNKLNILEVCLKASRLNKVTTSTELMAPRIRPAVAGLRVKKASFTSLEDLNFSIALAIIKIIITGPVIREIVAKIPPHKP